jgi:RHS repeat-associated protein
LLLVFAGVTLPGMARGADTPPPGTVVARADYSTTSRTNDGKLHTRAYPEPVNFQDEDGSWTPVDRTLESAGDGTVHPADVDGDATIPSSLEHAVKIEHDERSMTFRLMGADGDRDVSGTKADFDDAIPNVDVQYAARSLGLKETLVLQNASAQHVFKYDLRGDDDLVASIDASGELVLRDSSGKEQFRISAPLAWDSASFPEYSNALELSIEKISAGRWTLTMRVDQEWLNDPARVFPVSLDPDFYWVGSALRFHGANTDCYLSGGVQASTSYCSAQTLALGYYQRPYRPLLKFDVTQAVPANATVTGATLSMYQPGTVTNPAGNSRLYAVTTDWDSHADWDWSKTSTPWLTSGGGGDITSNTNLIGPPTAVAAAGNWYSWQAPLAAVQGWVNGTLPNYGLLMKTDTGAPATTAYSFTSTEGNQTYWPTLDVTWSVPDTTAPALTLSGPAISQAATWQTADTKSVTLSATDAGSGVQRVDILRGTTVLGSSTQTCSAGGCALSHSFDLDLSALPEGVNNLTAAAVDIGGLRTEVPFTVRTDRHNPTLSLTGSLVDQQTTNATTGTRSVTVASTDAGSGVRSLTMSVDGVQRETRTQACAAGGCALGATWSLDVGALSDGPHTVSIVATDGVSRTATRTLDVRVERYAMPPVPALSSTEGTPYVDQVDFLWTGSNPLQTGVAPGTIKPRQSAVIEGKVFNGEGVPAAGAEVSIVDHPEYGQTLTRNDGSYWMGVNGGGQLRVRYYVQGALPSERELDVKWNDYNAAPDVWLITPDPKGTNVTFGVASTSIQVASATPVTDSDGTRTTRVLVEPGTKAWGQKADGSRVPLNSGTMRVTEFTTGEHGDERMPASLPDSTSYTWAAEYQLDQAMAPEYQHVEFSKPVVSYTENFLHFPVGTDIPVGTYQPSEGRWTGDPDGRVIKVLSITSGKAVLDVTGFGAANQQELNHYNIDDAELTELGSIYHAGDTLWRTQLTHFSIDMNRRKARNKKHKKGKRGGHSGHQVKDCKKGGSIIGCQNQSLGEVADLGGTPYSLRYDSSRTPGAIGDRTITVPMTGDTLPEDLVRVDAQVVVAGQRLSFAEENPTPNEFHTFRWDGKDVFGRPMVGGAIADVEVANAYPSAYVTMGTAKADPNDYEWIELPYLGDGANVTWGDRTGGSDSLDRITTSLTPPSAPAQRPALQCNDAETSCWYPVADPPSLPVSRTDDEVASTYQVALPYLDARSAGVGGWTISDLHHYDVDTGTLFRGDGEQETAAERPVVVTTIKDIRNPGERYSTAGPIATLADGSVLGVDRDNGRVLRTWPGTGGNTTVFASGFSSPQGIAVGPDQSVYVAEPVARLVKKIAPDGTVTTVAGNGTNNGTYQDGADPTNPLQRQLNFPRALGVAPDGTLYIGDSSGILVVDPSGKMSRLAGVPFFGCGRANNECKFSSPPAFVIAVGADGTVYWDGNYDTAYNQLYKFSPGDKEPALVEEGYEFGTAKEGPLADSQIVPTSMAFDQQGRLLLADDREGQQAVWRLSDDSRVTKIGLAGCNTADTANSSQSSFLYQNDGGPFLDSCGDPQSIAVGPDAIYTMDGSGYAQIREIKPSLGRYPTGEILVSSSDGSEAYRFDKTGRQLATLDGRSGRVVRTFAYDGQDRISSITETDFGATTFTYGPAGVIVSGPDGQHTTIDYGPNGWADYIEDATGARQRFSYDATGLMTRREDELGHASTFVFNAVGRLASDSTALGRVQTLDRTENGVSKAVHHVDKSGATTTYETTYPDDDTSTDTRSSMVHPGGSRDSVTLSADGSTASFARADGSVSQIAPTPPATGTAAQTRFAGEDAPATSSTTLPSGLTVTASADRGVQRDPGSDPANPFDFQTLSESYTFAGHKATATYDKSSKTETVVSPLGRTSSITFDSHDRPVKATAPGRADITVDYDARGRLTAVHQGSQVETSHYGSDGYEDQVTDRNGRVTTTTRNSRGDVTSITGPDAQATLVSSDAAGRVVQVTAPDNRVFGFAYSDDGDVVSGSRSSKPGSALPTLTTGATYDSGGRLSTLSRASGKTWSQTYDAADRAVTSSASDGTSVTASYESVLPAPSTAGTGDTGHAGRLHSLVTNGGVESVLSYDGPLLSSVVTSGDVTGGSPQATTPAQVDIGYDNALRVSRLKVADADPDTYTYDNDGAVTSAGAQVFAHDPVTGDPVASVAAAVRSHATFDAKGDMSSQGWEVQPGATPAANVLSESVTRNPVGQIVGRTESDGSGATAAFAYQYDAAGRLVSVVRDGSQIESYGYDSSGGLVSQGTGLFSVQTTSDGYGRPVATSDGIAASWSADGELKSLARPGVGAEQFVYDGFGRVKSITLADGRIGQYRYDGLGRRVSVQLDGQLVRRFVYAGGLVPLARVDADGSVLERYVYGSQSQVPDLIIRRNGQRMRLVTDTLGSVRAVVDIDTGQVLERRSYGAYGRNVQDTNPGLQPFGFKGSISDPLADAAGLTWMGTRAYAQALARFTTPEPEGIAAAWNEHDALGGDPVNLIDSDGLAAVPVIPQAGPIFVGREAAQKAAVVAARFAAAAAAAYDFEEVTVEDLGDATCKLPCCFTLGSGQFPGGAAGAGVGAGIGFGIVFGRGERRAGKGKTSGKGNDPLYKEPLEDLIKLRDGLTGNLSKADRALKRKVQGIIKELGGDGKDRGSGR